MVDVEACTRTYKLSSNPLFIVMETPEQQLRDQVAAERKIYQEQESNEQLIKDIISQVADIKQRGNSYLCP